MVGGWEIDAVSPFALDVLPAGGRVNAAVRPTTLDVARAGGGSCGRVDVLRVLRHV